MLIKLFVFAGPYLFYTVSKTWQDADKHCKSLNGYMATITSEDENQLVKTLMEIKYVAYVVRNP